MFLIQKFKKKLKFTCDSASRYKFVFVSIFFISASPNVFADNSNQTDTKKSNTCAARDTEATKYSPPHAFTSENIDNTNISADFTKSSSDGSTSLEGNVVIEQHLLRVSADHAAYSQQQDVLQVSGNVHIDTETLALDADGGTVSMGKSDKQGEFSNIKFFIPSSNMKGKADTIHASGDKQSVLKNASITSCNMLNPDWLISADNIRLDHRDEYGSANDVIMRFKGIPFLYTPYIEFPISDKRRSGLLFPEIGNSTSRGVELAIPWYWNIAPNQDAVITPRFMKKRGLELGGNYRYLTQSTKGELIGSYLAEDDITQDERYQVRYQQHSRILPNLLFDVDLQDISDADYFNDFSNSLGGTSQTHLYRNATLRYTINNWQMQALVQNIKTIDTTTATLNRPYQRLPQLTLKGDSAIANGPLLFTLDSEFVDFSHEDDSKIIGTRSTIQSGLRLPLSGTAWFINSAVKFRHTQYDVGTKSGTSIDVEDINTPISSIDGGLFFERNLDNGYQQTLEPRLYYLNTPFENQSNTPIFDTSTPDFSIAQLFRDNRFIGGDRIGDTNQLTMALTSRILNPNSGEEFLRASIGQIFYFDDRQVSLDGSIDTAKQSDVIAELDTNWGYLKSNIDIQWNTTNSNLSKQNYFLHYKSDSNHLFNIGYRKRLQNNIIDIEQTDTSFVYAINHQYNALARWNYSLQDKKTIDSIAGISYDSCCWSIQLLAQRRLQSSINNDDAYDNSILVQFVLKGLGNLSGSKTRNTLEQSIHGYTDIFQ